MVTIEEKRKRDEMPDPDVHHRRIKFILIAVGLLIFGLIVFRPDIVLDLILPIRDYPNADVRDKIHKELVWRRGHKGGAGEDLVYIPFSIAPDQPICVYVSVEVFKDSNPEDVITWSEMSFNDRRLPADAVSLRLLTSSEMVKAFESYGVEKTDVQPALEICFKRGLLKSEPWTPDIFHLLYITVRDSATHEIFFYRWVIREDKQQP